MSDYGNLMEENLRLKAEIEELKAKLAEAQKPAEPDNSWVAAAEGADPE